MKKSLCLCLALVMALAMAATAKKMDPRTNLVTKDGSAIVGKVSGAKLPGVGTLVGTTGYADAWRATAGMAGKSIVVDPTGAKIGMALGKANGAFCDLLLAYSLDSGATWGAQTIAANMNTRIYNGLAMDSLNRIYIVWQDRTNNAIIWDRDEGGIGAGLWFPPDTLAKDSVAWYLPTMTVGGSNLIISAIAHGAAVPVGDYSIHMLLSHDLGETWEIPWDSVALPYGWNKWDYNEISGQGWDVDPVDWMFSGSGDTVVAFFDVVCDTDLYFAESGYAGFFPVYKMSFDGGITWGLMQMFTPPAQYWHGGWWYMYDGAWIGGRPYFLFTWQDGTWNGKALFVYYPTVAGDFSDWTCKRISDIPGNLAGVTPGDLNGGGINFPTISHDAAGNIYAIYQDCSKNNDNYEIFGVASTDKGNTWLNPVQLTTEAGQLDGNIYLEAAEFAGGDKIHMLFHDPAYTNIYYWNVPTSTILAGGVRPEEITLAPELCGSSEHGWGGPIDAVIDTVQGPGDTLRTFWSPKVALGGTYELQISKSANFSSDVWPYHVYLLPDVNYLGSVGLPETNIVWHWRVRSDKDGYLSPWSPVYDFYYKGTTINYFDWMPKGVTGGSDLSFNHKFALNQNRPNPVNKLAELSFTLPRSGNYSLKIYNISGQLIRNLDGRGVAGQNTVTWNGLDNSGRKTANGVYLYNLQAFGNSATKKMIILR
ncbi:MAG: T9SS type A sorting domain-containing protein [bacterium]|nr:T9SS type A sorting domain-containing protein [bacterium]